LDQYTLKLDHLLSTAVMGPGQKFLIWVGSAIYGLGFVLENFPYKSQIFQFFWSKKISSGRVKKYQVKTGLASYLLRVKSMLGSGRVYQDKAT